MTQNALIEIKNLSKTFYGSNEKNHLIVLDDINLTIKEGEFVVILGPSGCGKTTLLRIAAGLEKPTTGSVVFNNELVEGPSKARGMVFQEYTSFPWLNVFKNIEFGLIHQQTPKEKRIGIVRKYIDLVGLRGFEEAYPHQLSGGMQQRLAIARTLAVDPMALFLDEPFGALDAQTRQRLQEELLNVQIETGKTVFFVTHDIDEALILGSRIIVLSSLPGKIIHDEKRENRKRFSHGYSYSDGFIVEKRKYARLIEQRMMRVGMSDWDGHAPIYNALDENIIPSQIDITLGKSGTIRKQNFLDGIYDCLSMSLNELIGLMPKRAGRIVFSTIGSINSGTDVLVVRKNAVKTIQDLQKARLGVARESLEHIILAMIFDHYGFDFKTLVTGNEKLFLIQRRDYLEYLIENRVDAVMLCEPALTELFSSKEGRKFTILDTDIDQNLIQQVCFVSNKALSEKRDLVTKFIHFMQENNEYFVQNEQDILLRLHRKFQKLRPTSSFVKNTDVSYYLFENIKYYDLEENKSFYLEGELNKIILKLSNIALRLGIIENDLTEEALEYCIDKSFVEEILNEEENSK